MPKKIIISILLVAVFGGGLLLWYFGKTESLKPDFPDVEPVKTEDKENLLSEEKFFWMAEGQKNKVYFVGSIHLLREEDYPLPPVIEEIYNDSRVIIFETDIGAIEDPVFIYQMMEKMFYPPGEKLSQNISEDTLKILEERLSLYQLPVEDFEIFRPWAISFFLSDLKFEELAYDYNLGVDKYFYKKAKLDKKEINYLETPEYQIEIMAGLGKELQESFLKKTLEQLDTAESLLSDMVGAWKIGDINKMEEIAMQDFEPEIYDLFLIKRNKEWVPLVEELMEKEDNVLIIVGAGHLLGKDSLIELLKEKGYKIE